MLTARKARGMYFTVTGKYTNVEFPEVSVAVQVASVVPIGKFELQNGLEIKKNYTSTAQFLLEWIPKLNKDYELAKSKATKGKEVVFATSYPNWLPN